MEAVFSGGDIVKQLPQEAKRFQNIDKNFMKASCRGVVQGWSNSSCAVGLLGAASRVSPAATHASAVPLTCPPCWLCARCPGHAVASAPSPPCLCASSPQVVAHASETVNVVDTCVATELLRSMLPHLLEQLELTQKSLSAYLGALCRAVLRCAVLWRCGLVDSLAPSCIAASKSTAR